MTSKLEKIKARLAVHAAKRAMKRAEDRAKAKLARKNEQPTLRDKNVSWPFRFMSIGDSVTIQETGVVKISAAIAAAHVYAAGNEGMKFVCRTSSDKRLVTVKRVA